MKTGLREFVVISHTVAFVPDLLETKTLLIYSSVAMKGESGRDELLGVSGAKKKLLYIEYYLIKTFYFVLLL